MVLSLSYSDIRGIFLDQGLNPGPKMLKMILFAKQKYRHREQMYGYQGGKMGVDELGGCDDVYTMLCMEQMTSEHLLYLAHGTILSALWGPKWEGIPKKDTPKMSHALLLFFSRQVVSDSL